MAVLGEACVCSGVLVHCTAGRVGLLRGCCVGGATWHLDTNRSNLASSIICLNCFSNAWGFASPCYSHPIAMKVLWFAESVYLHNSFWNLNAHTSSGLQLDLSAYLAPWLSSGLSGEDSCGSLWAPILDLNGLHFLLLWCCLWREMLSSHETDSKLVSQFVPFTVSLCVCPSILYSGYLNWKYYFRFLSVYLAVQFTFFLRMMAADN